MLESLSPLAALPCDAGRHGIRCDCFLAVGGFDEVLSVHKDVEFYMRLAKAGAVMRFDWEEGYVMHTHASRSNARRVTRDTGARARIACYDRILAMHGELQTGARARRRKYMRSIAMARQKARCLAVRGAAGDGSPP